MPTQMDGLVAAFTTKVRLIHGADLRWRTVDIEAAGVGCGLTDLVKLAAVDYMPN